MRLRVWNLLASFSLLALIVLCVLWEAWLAPLRPGGSWMILKAAPLLPAVFGILHGRRYTHQWLSMLALLYFTEGVVRTADPAPVSWLAGLEVLLAVLLAGSCMLYARYSAPSRQHS